MSSANRNTIKKINIEIMEENLKTNCGSGTKRFSLSVDLYSAFNLRIVVSNPKRAEILEIVTIAKLKEYIPTLSAPSVLANIIVNK